MEFDYVIVGGGLGALRSPRGSARTRAARAA